MRHQLHQLSRRGRRVAPPPQRGTESAHVGQQRPGHDLTTTRATLRTLAPTEFTADEPTVASSAYQQILAVLRAAPAGMRARDICLALDIEPLPKHVEGARAKLKRMVKQTDPDRDPTRSIHLRPETDPTSLTASLPARFQQWVFDFAVKPDRCGRRLKDRHYR
jgi:hypothetical protein